MNQAHLLSDNLIKSLKKNVFPLFEQGREEEGLELYNGVILNSFTNSSSQAPFCLSNLREYIKSLIQFEGFETLLFIVNHFSHYLDKYVPPGLVFWSDNLSEINKKVELTKTWYRDKELIKKKLSTLILENYRQKRTIIIIKSDERSQEKSYESFNDKIGILKICLTSDETKELNSLSDGIDINLFIQSRNNIRSIIEINKYESFITKLLLPLEPFENFNEKLILNTEEKKDLIESFVFFNVLLEKKWNVYINIPSIVFDEDLRSSGSFTLFLKNKNDNQVESLVDSRQMRTLKRIVTEFYGTIGLIESKSKIVATIGKHSLRSAVAAIMGRNMSHNIGSHVLSNLKDETSKIAENLFEIKDFEIKTAINFFDFYKNKLKLNSSFFYGFTWFLNYLQERQDYIATISGFENQTFIPVNFKSFILDGFLPDHRYERHKNGNSEVKNYKNYLLEYITKSENLSRDSIKTYFRDFETSKNPQGDSVKTFELVKLLNISLPGGILGRQAIFSILENFIRNSAKHSKSIVELKIIIDTPDLYYDEKSKSLKIKNKKKENGFGYDTNDLIKVTLTDNVKSYNVAEENLNKAIIDPLIDKETGILKPNYKGIKEMRISAAWLRGISIYEIDDFKKHNPQILSVGDSEEGSIQYTFYLLKPKELLIIISNKSLIELDLKDDFKNQLLDFGIEILSIEELVNKTTLRHSLFAIEKGININDVKSKFNQRVISVNNEFIKQTLNELNNKMDNDTIKTFLAKYWNERLKRIDKCNSNIPIYIDDYFEKRDETDYFKVSPSENEIKVLFRKHNDSKEEFDAFKGKSKDIYDKLLFLEGISGGNSTDLYLRKLPKDEILYYKLLESCLTKVLIIDERIWNFTAGCDILDLFKKSNDDIKKILNNHINENDPKTWAEAICNELGVNDENKITELKEKFGDKSLGENQLIKDLKELGLVQDFGNGSNKDVYKYELFHKKGIEILNICFTNDFKKCEFYNINTNNVKPILVLKKDEKGNLTAENGLTNNFHIVSIHQGIIDKIQEKMGVSFTKTFETLKAIFNDPIIRVIHSGRGKPSSKIPEGFYFLPYASLENAFNDCKYSLTEILYNVKEEQK